MKYDGFSCTLYLQRCHSLAQLTQTPVGLQTSVLTNKKLRQRPQVKLISVVRVRVSLNPRRQISVHLIFKSIINMWCVSNQCSLSAVHCSIYSMEENHLPFIKPLLVTWESGHDYHFICFLFSFISENLRSIYFLIWTRHSNVWFWQSNVFLLRK